MHKQLYCIRHGEALHNVLYPKIGTKAYTDYLDTPLTEKGVLQSKTLNKTFKEIDDIELVLVSPLTRTLDTCVNIFKNKTIPILSLDELVEHPQSKEKCNKRDKTINLKKKYKSINFSFLNDESIYWSDEYNSKKELLKLENRISQLKSFIKSRKEMKIAIVSHSTFLKKFLYDDYDTDFCKELKHCYPYKIKI